MDGLLDDDESPNPAIGNCAGGTIDDSDVSVIDAEEEEEREEEDAAQSKRSHSEELLDDAVMGSDPPHTKDPDAIRAQVESDAALAAALAEGSLPPRKKQRPGVGDSAEEAQGSTAAAATTASMQPTIEEEDFVEDACIKCLELHSYPGNELLLCDGEGCGAAWHLHCLKPKLISVPKGDWCDMPLPMSRGMISREMSLVDQPDALVAHATSVCMRYTRAWCRYCPDCSRRRSAAARYEEANSIERILDDRPRRASETFAGLRKDIHQVSVTEYLCK